MKMLLPSVAACVFASCTLFGQGDCPDEDAPPVVFVLSGSVYIESWSLFLQSLTTPLSPDLDEDGDEDAVSSFEWDERIARFSSTVVSDMSVNVSNGVINVGMENHAGTEVTSNTFNDAVSRLNVRAYVRGPPGTRYEVHRRSFGSLAVTHRECNGGPRAGASFSTGEYSESVSSTGGISIGINHALLEGLSEQLHSFEEYPGVEYSRVDEDLSVSAGALGWAQCSNVFGDATVDHRILVENLDVTETSDRIYIAGAQSESPRRCLVDSPAAVLDYWDATNGDRFELRCSGGRFQLFYMPSLGGERCVGVCPWCGGRNDGYLDVCRDNEGRISRFRRSFWRSRQPFPWETCSVRGQTCAEACRVVGCIGVLDWVQFEFDVETGELIRTHFISVDGREGVFSDDVLLRGEVESACEFDDRCIRPALREKGIGVDPTVMVDDPFRACDLDLDGDCDADDAEIASTALGQCIGDDGYIAYADSDHDGCITEEDIDETHGPIPGEVLQLPGDCNQDGTLDVSDGVCLLGFLFLGTPETLPCGDGTIVAPSNVALLDWHPPEDGGSGTLAIGDAVFVFRFLFLDGPPHPLGIECIDVPGCPRSTCAP